MTVMIVVGALAVLALITQAGVFAVQRAHPPQGRMVEVEILAPTFGDTS